MSDNPSLDVDHLLAQAGWIRRLALGIVGDSAAADDVVQDTLVTAIERPPRGGVPLAPWLARVARHIAWKSRRSDVRRTQREAGAARVESVPPDESLARAEAYRAVADAVVALEAPYREVVLLRYFDGLPTGEIAVRLGVPVETVRTRLKRAHAMLRARLQRDDDDRRGVLGLVLATASAPTVGPARGIPAARTAAILGGALVTKKLLVAATILLALLVGTTLSFRKTLDLAPAVPAAVASSATPDRQRAPETAAAPVVTPTAVDPLPSGPQIRGRVIDEIGRPVSGATVLGIPSSPLWRSQGTAHATSTLSNEDGSFVLAVADEAPLFRVLGDAAGHAPDLRDDVRAGEDLTLTLGAGESIGGRVRDMDGHSVADATVRWIGSVGGAAALVRTATSDADGAYRIDGLPSHGGGFRTQSYVNSDLSVIAEAPGYARLIVHPPDGARLAAQLDLWMVRGCIVEGVVVDGETGAPVVGARVACAELGARFVRASSDGLVTRTSSYVANGEVRSDAEGKFRFERVQAEGVFRLSQNPGGTSGAVVGHVVASAPGYVDACADVPVVEDGTLVSARIVLWRAARVEGRVLESDGAPCVGASVAASVLQLQGQPRWFDLDDWPAAPRIVSDDKGRYALPAVPARRGAPIRATIYSTRPGETNNVGENNTMVEVELRAGETSEAPDIVFGGMNAANASAWVRVLNPAGAPVWGATASLDQWMTESVADRSGRLRFAFSYNRAGIPPRPQRLIVRARGFAPAVTPEFTPARDDPPEVVVTLGTPHRLAGRVLRADGSPVADAHVSVRTAAISREEAAADVVPGSPETAQGRPALVSYGMASTAQDGSFTVLDLPEGPYWVFAGLNTGGDTQAACPIATDATDVLVTLRNVQAPTSRSGATVDATIVDGGTRVPVLAAQVTLRNDASGEHLDEVPWEERGFTLHRWSGVAEGPWRIDVTAPGWLAARRVVDVQGTGPIAVEIGLSRGGTVVGTLTTPPDFRPEDAYVRLVSLEHPDVGSGQAVRPDARGRFAIRGVPPGRWRAVVARANTPLPVVCAADRFVVDVAEGTRETRLDVIAVRGGTIGVSFRRGGDFVSVPFRCEVLDGRGRAVSAMAVEEPVGGMSVELPPGTYDVRMTPKDGAEQTRRAVVVATEFTQTVFDIP